MKEEFQILSNQPANVIIFSAMVDLAEKKNLDIMDMFKLTPEGDASKAQIEVLVNGVPIPFVECFAEAIKNIDKYIGERAKEKAIELLKESSLIDLYNRIQDMEYEFSVILDKVQKEANNET